MLDKIKAIIASASEKELESPEFQKYLKQLIVQPKHWCAQCYNYRERKYLRNNLWYCNSCILRFNEE